MKQSLAFFVGAIALALVMLAPSKASAQQVNIYVGPGYSHYGGYGHYPSYGYGYGHYPSYGYGYTYPRYGYGYTYPNYGYGPALEVSPLAAGLATLRILAFVSLTVRANKTTAVQSEPPLHS